jgi:hypothetical protein
LHGFFWTGNAHVCQADVPYDAGWRQFSAVVALYIGALQAAPLQGSQRGEGAAVVTVPPEFFADCFDPQILEEIHRFRKIIYDKIDQLKLLPNEESEVLFELIEHLPDSNYASLIETVDKVSKQVGKSKLDTMGIINKLVERKVVQLGISYPF